jgi:ribose-phosphate pyrophosphokinase
MIKLNGHIVTPTIFPDKTSQVWKLQTEISVFSNTITWEFENEAEFMHVAQLQELISRYANETILELPYLPYARQDKEVGNYTTFALFTFAQLLNTLKFSKVKVFDPHNVELSADLIKNLEVEMPYHGAILDELNASPVYPDKGAAKRYCALPGAIVFDKVREPLTGAIVGLTVDGLVARVPYLIVDDICDGGRTFIEVAKVLYKMGAAEVHLYISHGIFSKGLGVLRDAGIKRIFTRNGEVK